MQYTEYIYRALAYLKHRLTSTNTLGHGIQSPSLYYMVRMLVYDDNRYYCFNQLEQERLRLLRDHRRLLIQDFGTGQSGKRTISAIAQSSLAKPAEVQMLFKILQDRKPKTIIELGTSLGLTTVYFSKAAPQANILTFEGSPSLLQEAQTLWQSLSLNNITPVLGNIDQTLNSQLSILNSQLDFVFIDANHTEEATIRYFETILPYCHAKTLLVFDDIHYSRGMGRAWEYIQQHPKVRTTMDFYDLGFAFLNPEYLKSHFRLRI